MSSKGCSLSNFNSEYCDRCNEQKVVLNIFTNSVQITKKIFPFILNDEIKLKFRWHQTCFKIISAKNIFLIGKEICMSRPTHQLFSKFIHSFDS